ncbi:YjbR protein [Mucilaginibacter mallensis]|uniref:YjbR protein n=1 Tax=Mucilaginibacter mallensis TaxID=652787 RepID=A0A1H1R0J3_MUCMA|nr:MmcQ/YjbR family DNA-binding protein [Mucilaginibacter mallensis]SDS29203.1 YjbR protein [Mucilaginibacter mallensis]
MVNTETVREIALSLPGTVEHDHFGMPSFRVNNKIFSTLWIKENKVMVKLSPIDQSVFVAFDNSIFYPVPNKWGLQGATFVELAKVRHDMLKDALATAWQTILDNRKRKTH